MQFFFHVVGGRIDYDDSGEDFPSVQTAIVHAFLIAAELRADCRGRKRSRACAHQGRQRLVRGFIFERAA